MLLARQPAPAPLENAALMAEAAAEGRGRRLGEAAAGGAAAQGAAAGGAPLAAAGDAGHQAEAARRFEWP